uniref:RING-type domain-containing protein n=1 Tax=Rhizophora mucronata TaxID=61149 RepID=A0A2P2KQL4_RHIMU
MVSDSITPSASVPCVPKDLGKKKRTNRSAKLKQCKLDARREQWLSQGTVKKTGCKEELNGSHASPLPPCKNVRKNSLGNLEMRQRTREEDNENQNRSMRHDFDLDSPSNSPTSSSVVGGTDAGTSFSGSSSRSSSSSSSGGCCSGSITEEEEVGDDNCLEDWEAVADALAADDENKQENRKDSPCLESESSPQLQPMVQVDSSLSNLAASSFEDVKECPRAVPPRLTPGNNRAWRPDDEFRPHCLPNLSKQRSLPNADRKYGPGGLSWACASAVNVPSSCPICYEDLDITDTSFLPCLCGFRLCLFCHKRILEEDGRCPGCRKPYEHNTLKAEASVHGGSLTFRLARSCSMIMRS